MAAICKCGNGHTFSSRVVADEPDTNYFEVADQECPECGSTEIEVIEIEPDDEGWPDL